MNINQLYDKQAALWKAENEKYFGITPLKEWDDPNIVNSHLAECCDKFWNNGTNETKKELETSKCNDIDKMIDKSYELKFESSDYTIRVYASFKDLDGNIKRSPLIYLPAPTDLCWYFGFSKYILRITASYNFFQLRSKNNIVSCGRTWYFYKDTKEFEVSSKFENYDPYDKLSNTNRMMLEALLGCELTRDNFVDALCKVPEINRQSILSFQFLYVDEIFDILRNTRRFANPLKHIPIAINFVNMISKQRMSDEKTVDRGASDNLVICNNNIFALENARTAIYKSDIDKSFNFEDCSTLFDSFKTSTNKSAGKSRLILDNVFIKDNVLWNYDVDGNERNMYDLVLNNAKVSTNLSSISMAAFNYNDEAKRIMMTAKLRAQAIPVAGEINSFTHEIPARIVFGDFKGFNYGDAIIISRSFAKKLRSHTKEKRTVRNDRMLEEFLDKYKIGDMILPDDFVKLFGTNSFLNYRNIKFLNIQDDSVTFEADVPFSVGDKLTNFHGSKGIATMIFEDEDMPYLVNDLGPNMPKGYMDIIVSGLSVFKRRSFGQIFEAWALASGIDDVDCIYDAKTKYGEQMKEFSKKSVIRFNGTESIHPCGINMIIRLCHNSSDKQSFSKIRSNYAHALKFGEMELLNLAARGLCGIINELDIRSMIKYKNSLQMIQELQKTGEAPYMKANDTNFFKMMEILGYSFNVDGVINENSTDKQSIISNDVIDLFDEWIEEIKNES